jgi:uncharacterized oxidoreductase
MTATVVLEPNRLRAVVNSIFAFHGCAAVEAAAIARHLLESDLYGHASHGCGLVPLYVELLMKGDVFPNRTIERLPLTQGFLLFDGGRGFGQSLGVQLVDEVLVHARAAGTAVFGLRNAHHLGRIGDYGERFAAADFASVLFVNTVSRPIVAPFGGAEARMGTNPICITIPRRNAPPIVLDFATSAIAVGKCRVALEKGEPIPPGSAMDALGEPTTDPRVLYASPQGALKPMGGYKGSGLNLVTEIFSACIGGLTMSQASPQSGGAINSLVGMCFRMALLPGAFDGIESVAEYFLATRPARQDGPVKLPGTTEREAYAQRHIAGVPMASATWARIADLARAAKIPEAEIRAVTIPGHGS